MSKWNAQTTIGGTAVAVDDLLLLSDQSQAAGSRDRNISVSDLSYATGRFSVGQTGHGLSVGDCVWFDGTDYVEATADTLSNARVIGVIVEVIDVDNIVIQSTGFAFGLSGLVAGSTYYLQDAGGLGTTAGTFVVPVLLATSTTTGWLLFGTANEPDYEEGTWTPTFTNLTIGTGTSQGRYTRIARLVRIEIYVLLNATSSVTGAVSITGLPFTNNSLFASSGVGYAIDQGTGFFPLTGPVNLSATSISLRCWSSNSIVNVTNTVPFTWSGSNGDSFRFDLTYSI